MVSEAIETYITHIAETKEVTPEKAIEQLLARSCSIASIDGVDPTDIQGGSSNGRRKLSDTLNEIGESVRKGTVFSIKYALLDLYSL